MKRLAIGLGVAALLLGCDKPQPVEAPAPVAAKPEIAAPQPSVSDMLNAMLRAHPHSTQVCYNETQDDGISFFIHWREGSEEDKLHGWYWINKVGFWQTQAKTWYTQEWSDDKYVKVFPDVTGLDCKSQ